jgi:hypothetical protein
MLFDVFIGYSRRDSASAAAIQAALEQAGVRCYRDVTDIADSDEWRAAISAAISESHVFLALISKDSLASPYAGREMALAFDAGKRLMPVLLAVPETAIAGDVGFFIRGLQYIYARPTLKLALPGIVSTAVRLVDQSKYKTAYEAEKRVKSRANLTVSLDFGADRMGLPIGVLDAGTARLERGVWIGTAKPGEYFGHHLDKMPEATEFVVEVRIQKLDGPDDDWFGLEFGQSWPGDYFQFALNGNGSFKFAKRVNETWREEFRVDNLPAAEIGGRPNLLKVVRCEKSIHVFVNQLHAATLEDGDVGTGRLGVLIGKGMQVGFSKLQIHAVDPARLFTHAMDLWNRLEMREARGLLGYLSRFGSGEQMASASELLCQVWPDRHETVLIVIGALMDALLHDQAPAETLREFVNRKGDKTGHRWATVVTDAALLDEPKYLDCALIALGGPLANRITADLQPHLTIDPACAGRLMVQHHMESGDRRLAVWGPTVKDTANAADFLISSGMMDRFLKLIWGEEEA